MGMFDFDDMVSGTIGGAIAGGILGSMFGDSAAEKAVGALAGAIIGDYVSDELEGARDNRKVVVVHQPQQQPYPYYQPTQSSYFDTLKYELDRESLMILNSCSPNENKKRSLRALKDRVSSAYYGHKITYHESCELESFIDSRIKLCDW